MRAGIEALVSELFAQSHDRILQVIGDAERTGTWSPRARLQARFTLGIEAPAQLVDPLTRHAVISRHLRLGSPFHLDRGDHQQRQRHRSTPWIEV